MMCGHPELAWFSNRTERWPAFPRMASLSRLYASGILPRRAARRLVKPDEGYRLWDRCRAVEDSPCDPPLTEEDVRDADISCIRELAARHVRYQRASRFINKNTRNTRRIRFLNRIFADALFIHIIRDPRATVNSLLKVAFWPTLRIWCHDGVTPIKWRAEGRDPAVLAAELWMAEVQRALDDKDVLPPERYFELRYEDLTARPAEVLSDILQFTGLDWTPRFKEFVDGFRLSNMNSKYKTELDDERISSIEQLVTPLAWRLGYQPQFSDAESLRAAV
jgi:hypothetical protein